MGQHIISGKQDPVLQYRVAVNHERIPAGTRGTDVFGGHRTDINIYIRMLPDQSLNNAGNRSSAYDLSRSSEAAIASTAKSISASVIGVDSTNIPLDAE